MNKQDLIRAIADRTGDTHATVERIVSGAIDAMSDQLRAGGPVKLVGFLKMDVKTAAARMHHNPKTGAPVHTPARRVVKAKVAPGILNGEAA